MRIIDWSSDVCSSDLASAHWRGNICCPTRIRRSGKSDRTNAVQAARKIPPHALPDRAGGYPERRDRTQNVVPVPRDGGYRDQARYRWAHNVDRKSVVSGKSVSVRVDLGGRRIITKKNKNSI